MALLQDHPLPLAPAASPVGLVEAEPVVVDLPAPVTVRAEPEPAPPARFVARRDLEVDRLFRRLRATGDPRAREALVQRFLPLARQLARRYEGRGGSLDDLIQTASLGLVKAVDRFDPERGVAFSSFAVPTIVGELKRYFRDSTWAVRVPRGQQERVLLLERTERELAGRGGRPATAPQLAAAAGMSLAELLDTMQAAQAYSAVSLDAPRGGAGEDEADSYADRLGAIDGRFGLIEDADFIAPAVRSLPERDRLVLRLRFEEELTQSEIAARIGVSQMQVSRILRRVTDRLETVAAKHRMS